MYFDEVGLSGKDVSKYTPAQLAERYARYKVKRGRLYAPWTWDDKEQKQKNIDKANSLIKERTEKLGDEKVNEAYLRYEEVYKDVAKQVSAADKAAETDYVRSAEMWSAIEKDAKTYDTYEVFRDADSELDDIVKCYMSAKTPQEANLCQEAIIAYKAKMVAALNNVGTKKEDASMNELDAVAEDFYRKYDAMQK